MREKFICIHTIFVLFLLLFSSTQRVCAQSISISPDGSPPDSSAILDIQSTTKGLLIPRMTEEQRDSILLPVLGLTIFQMDGIPGMYYYDGTVWTPVGTSTPVGDWPQNGDDIYNSNPGNIGIGTTAPEGKLHIKGVDDISQLIIEASEMQSDTNPLIRIRKNDGTDLMWIHANRPENIFIGIGAGSVNNETTAVYNTFIGSQSGLSTISGGGNTAVGASTLKNNSVGYNNTGIGFESLEENTVGGFNTAVGMSALSQNRVSSQNTAIGGYALYSQSYSPGYQYVSGNTAVGYESLFSNQPSIPDNGNNNTAVGRSSMAINLIGHDNVATGAYSLFSNTSGSDNTAIGASALYTNSDGYQNTAIGRQALIYNIHGVNNAAVGYKALRQNTTGDGNIAMGSFSLIANNEGQYNAAFGLEALYENTTGSYNTACGDFAMSENLTGNYNTSLGYLSGTGATNLINTVNIGNNGYLNQASNQDFIGNLSTAWIGGQTTWFTYASDARVKKNVQDDVKGLDFISRLRPVTYNLDITAMRQITGNKDTEDFPEKYDIEKIKQNGFLAQEVEQAAIESGYNFNGYTTPKTDTELYTMSYSLFVVPLVKAVQELSQENTQLKDALNQMKSENEVLAQRIEKIESILSKK